MNKEEFKEIRQQMKLRGAALAKRLGKTTEEVYAYETGSKSIPSNISEYLKEFKK